MTAESEQRQEPIRSTICLSLPHLPLFAPAALSSLSGTRSSPPSIHRPRRPRRIACLPLCFVFFTTSFHPLARLCKPPHRICTCPYPETPHHLYYLSPIRHPFALCATPRRLSPSAPTSSPLRCATRQAHFSLRCARLSQCANCSPHPRLVAPNARANHLSSFRIDPYPFDKLWLRPPRNTSLKAPAPRPHRSTNTAKIPHCPLLHRHRPQPHLPERKPRQRKALPIRTMHISSSRPR